MCGIFGYIGFQKATPLLVNGLRKLEYRGYDSAGICLLEPNKLKTIKAKGRVGELARKVDNEILPATIGISHTRWATHGEPSERNAHPHLDCQEKIAVVHNGIIENYQALKKLLEKEGHCFLSDTDTEVVSHLIEKFCLNNNFEEAVLKTLALLEGAWGLAILKAGENKIIAAKKGSPLILGIGNNEMFLASDASAILEHTKKVVYFNDGEMVVIDQKGFLTKMANGDIVKKEIQELKWDVGQIEKAGFKHFMLKEIYEQPQVIQQVIQQNKKGLMSLANQITKSKNVFCIGSGTAGAAASQIAYYLRVFGKINAIGLIGAECSEYLNLLNKNDLIIVPSQSGETADVLEIIEKAKKKGVKIASYVNMPGSLMTKMSNFAFMSNAGPEICVMSTKVFVSQICFGYLLSKLIQKKYQEGVNNLKKLAVAAEDVLKNKKRINQIKKLAQKLIFSKHVFLLGKGQNLQIIKEGMIKIIEGSYLHAHAIPAGDLKHYAITLMETGVPVIVVTSEDNVKDDVINAVNEVQARGAEIIFLPELPNLKEVSAILNIIPLQLLAYYMADYLGNNVDKPRNIAKSVTVK